MKKLIFIIAALLVVGCTEADKNYRDMHKAYDPGQGADPVKVYIIDSCEYLGKIRGYQSDILTHKGNCKFCEQRKIR